MIIDRLENGSERRKYAITSYGFPVASPLWSTITNKYKSMFLSPKQLYKTFEKMNDDEQIRKEEAENLEKERAEEGVPPEKIEDLKLEDIPF